MYQSQSRDKRRGDRKKPSGDSRFSRGAHEERGAEKFEKAVFPGKKTSGFGTSGVKRSFGDKPSFGASRGGFGAKRSFGGDRAERPSFGGDRAERPARASFGGERSERPSFGERSERPSFGGARGGSRGGFGAKRSFGGDRAERPSFGERSERPSFGERSERPSFGGARGGSRGGFGAKRSFGGDRAERPSFGARSERPSFGERSERPSFGERSERPSFGERSERPSFGGDRAERPSFGGDRDSAPRRSFGGRPSFGGSRGGSRGGDRRGGFGGGGGNRRGGRAPRPIDVSKFINKAVVEEKVEKFIPEHRFTDFKFHEHLEGNITDKGYRDPTPIQDRAIPHVMKGQDVVGIANTGTGKTAAFLLPLINKVLHDKNVRVLIMVPTRELATQINDELKGFTRNMGIGSAVCVGGAAIFPQVRDLNRKPSFVIGTPGRLKDFIERRTLQLQGFNAIVLDEADRMLDMGFINDMRDILSKVNSEHQTLFFSATLSPEIEKLIGEFLKNPVSISVKSGVTAKNVEQNVVIVERGADKVGVLYDLLLDPNFEKVLVFGRTKHGVEKLSKILSMKGLKSESIHGNKSQAKRQRALDMFKRGMINILCATDVAARGLDINDVSHVINFELPESDEDYIHRIGRTGRAGKKGKALTFVEQR